MKICVLSTVCLGLTCSCFN